jgi:hypothetical protein
MIEHTDMDTNHCALPQQNQPDSSIVYKVRVEIEQYAEINGVGTTMDAPGASLAEFSSYEDAYAFAQAVRHTFEAHVLPLDHADAPPE